MIPDSPHPALVESPSTVVRGGAVPRPTPYGRPPTASRGASFLGIVADVAAIALAAALAVPAAWPLLTTQGIPVSDDGLFHLYRLYEFAGAWREQGPIVRWSDRFMYGAGFPFFTFYSPLVYYVGTLLMRFGLDLTSAYKLLFALGLALSGMTMYLWARSVYRSRAAGLLGAAAYVYAPYFLVDVYRRGSVADCFAFALLPACLFTTRRLRERPTLVRGVLCAALMALLLVTHNAMAFFFLPLLGVWVVASALWSRRAALASADARWERVRRRPVASRLVNLVRQVRPFGVAGLLALALSAWFWVPALVERDLLDLTFHRTGYFDFRGHWDDGWPALQTSLVFDWTVPFRVGLVQAALAAAGCVSALANLARRREGVFWAAVALGSVGLMWPGTEPLWDRVPLLQYAEFAWRLLPFFALGGAFLTAALAAQVAHRARPAPVAAAASFAVAGFAAATLAAASMVGLAPAWQTVTDFRPLAISNATRIAGWAVPPAAVVPAPAAVTGSVRLLDARERFAERRYRLAADAAAPVTLHAFGFPGWMLTVDGEPTPYLAVAPDGLLQFELPAGEHDVTLALGRTPLERVAETVSGVAAVLLFVGPLLLGLIPRRRAAVAVLLVTWPLMAGLAFSFVRVEAGPSRPADGEPAGFRAVNQAVTDSVELSGYTVDESAGSDGRRARVTLYWRATRAMTDDLPLHVWIGTDDGETVGVRNVRAVGDALPTDRWPAGLIVADARDFVLPDDLRLDVAWLKVGVSDWNAPTASRTLLGEAVLDLATGRPAPFSARGAAVETAWPRVGGLFAVLPDIGAAADNTWRPSDRVDLGVTVRALVPVPRDYVFAIHLLDHAGRTVAVDETEPDGGRYPTGVWSAGEEREMRFALELPPELATGRVRPVLSAYAVVDRSPLPASTGDGRSLPEGIVLGRLVVLGGGVTSELPAAAIPVGAVFGDELELVGWSRGEHPGVYTLYWRAPRRPTRDYTLFVHALDAAGDLAAQFDGQPLGGALPTTDWQPGVVVAIPVQVALPVSADPRSLTLTAGAYVLESGTRLTLADGTDAADLGPAAP